MVATCIRRLPFFFFFFFREWLCTLCDGLCYGSILVILHERKIEGLVTTFSDAINYLICWASWLKKGAWGKWCDVKSYHFHAKRMSSLLLLFTFLKCWMFFVFLVEVLVGGVRGARNSSLMFATRYFTLTNLQLNLKQIGLFIAFASTFRQVQLINGHF